MERYSVLPYETAHHAKAIFSRWLSGSMRNGTPPSEADASSFADAAVRLAKAFSRVAEGYLEKEKTTEIRKRVTFEELIEEWPRTALAHVRPDVRRHTL